MKKSLLIVVTALFSIAGFAQVQEFRPMVSTNGEGKVKVAPDQATIVVSIETRGTNATDVKKQNDAATEKVVKYLKSTDLPKSDVQTQRVSLNPIYDYEKKKYSYHAMQTIEIFLRDLNKYDALMGGLTDSGINRIEKVEFKSSKLAQYEAEARKLAIAEAKKKADDYVSVVGQKVGKALTITDNTQVYYPQPAMYRMKAAGNMEADAAPETLATGEITITANVAVSFALD